MDAFANSRAIVSGLALELRPRALPARARHRAVLLHDDRLRVAPQLPPPRSSNLSGGFERRLGLGRCVSRGRRRLGGGAG
eukprot:5789093-Pyramimonas_sp.AAC.1